MSWWKLTQQFVFRHLEAAIVIIMVGVVGSNLILTGSPIPCWQIEQLNHPVSVRSVTASKLILETGQEVTIPFIKGLPHDNPLFKTAISQGVEISPDGTLFGLMWVDRYCGNDLVVWRKWRIDLSVLAGALHPEGIDDTLVRPDILDDLRNHPIKWSPQSFSHQRHRLSGWEGIFLRRIQHQLREGVAQTGDNPPKKSG